MGREIRKVPAGWVHLKVDDWRCKGFRPLYDKSYGEAIAEWIENHNKWIAGTHPDQADPEVRAKYRYYAEWGGNMPDIEYYRPDWTVPADHFQVYETVSEGTPTSPVFASLEELRDWLIGEGYSRAAADDFIEAGWHHQW